MIKNKNKKNFSIAIGSIVAVFILSFAIFNSFNKGNFDTKRLKGDVTATVTLSVSCNPTSIENNSTTNCTLTGSVSGGKVISVIGTLSASKLEITSVSPNTSIFSKTSSGTQIYYVAGETDITGNFTIATFSAKGVEAGSGSVTFTPNNNQIRTDTGLVSVSAATANVTVTAPIAQVSHNTNLGNLTVTGATIGTFSPSKTEYGANVDSSVTSVTISATKAESTQTLSGDIGTHTLEYGNNTYTITVTAEDGTSSKPYKITIYRASASLSTNNNIGSIVVKNGSETVNIGTVSANKTEYKDITVANSVSSVNISATAADSTATVTGNLGNKGLIVGSNTFKIYVKSQSGSTKTYTLIITRSSTSGGATTGKSAVCTLSELNVTNTKISNNFSSTVYSYKASVKNSVDSVTITAKATDSKAGVAGTGKKSLNVGNNSFTIIVTAENGSKKVYSITIVREGSTSSSNSTNSTTSTTSTKTEDKKDNNALLKELIINDNKMTLSDDTFSYNYTVLYEIVNVDIKATAKSDKAKVKVAGNKDLQVGKNTVIITVTAEDGTEKVYLINVTKKEKNEVLSDDSTLSTLEISGYDIKFDPTVKKYEVKINKEKQLTIDYATSNENANVVITGNENLKNGSVVTVEVTAEDGTKSKYEITVKKSGSAKAFLFTILGIGLVGGIGYGLFILIKKMPKKEKKEDTSVATFSQADVYDEYIKNTQVPNPDTYISEEAAMVTEPDNVEENTSEQVTNEEVTNSDTFITDEANIVTEPETTESEEIPSAEVQSEEQEIAPVEPVIPTEEEVPNEPVVEENQEDLSQAFDQTPEVQVENAEENNVEQTTEQPVENNDDLSNNVFGDQNNQ